MKKLLIATQNLGKLEEYRTLLSPLGYNLLSLTDLGIQDQAEESGATFAENSLIKSTHGYKLTGVPCLADDSGLEIDSLGGDPGIYSARYGGDKLTDQERCQLILTKLAKIPSHERQARFVCCISIIGLASAPIIGIGGISGIITNIPQGDYGFGYDPIFMLPSLNKTMAELPSNVKNLISHRADALRKIKLLIERLEIL